jgi:hypothetical protein
MLEKWNSLVLRRNLKTDLIEKDINDLSLKELISSMEIG